MSDIKCIRTPKCDGDDIAIITCSINKTDSPHIATSIALRKTIDEACTTAYDLTALNQKVTSVLNQNDPKAPDEKITHWTFVDRTDCQDTAIKNRALPLHKDNQYTGLKVTPCYSDYSQNSDLFLIGGTEPTTGLLGYTGEAGNSGSPVLLMSYTSQSKHIEFADDIVIVGVYTNAECVPVEGNTKEEAKTIEQDVDKKAAGFLNNAFTPIIQFKDDDIKTT
ncbi:MAG: hypothetical protein HRT35_20710 [Algicola sp.]|nr:hypothetical protein [Algicola sp.]